MDYVNTLGEDFSGNQFAGSARLTIAGGVSWNQPDSGLFAQMDGNYASGAPDNLRNSAFSDGRVLFNAQVGYEWENYTISAFVRNAFDKQYLTDNLSNLVVGDLAVVGAPRVFGGELKFSF